jgi:hypothetical protein
VSNHRSESIGSGSFERSYADRSIGLSPSEFSLIPPSKKNPRSYQDWSRYARLKQFCKLLGGIRWLPSRHLVCCHCCAGFLCRSRSRGKGNFGTWCHPYTLVEWRSCSDGHLAYAPCTTQGCWPSNRRFRSNTIADCLGSLLAAILASAIALFVVSREEMGLSLAIVGSASWVAPLRECITLAWLPCVCHPYATSPGQS